MDRKQRASMGGKARAVALTPEQRSESARKAVRARWVKSGKGITPERMGFTLVIDGSNSAYEYTAYTE